MAAAKKSESKVEVKNDSNMTEKEKALDAALQQIQKRSERALS